MLRGGPRAGQLVDDLPRGYRLMGEWSDGPAQLVIGELVAVVAVWPTREPGASG